MKTKEIKSNNLIKVPEMALLSLVANKLKDRTLFPQKIENAKKYLKEIKISSI